jgi:hypothetical protein
VYKKFDNSCIKDKIPSLLKNYLTKQNGLNIEIAFFVQNISSLNKELFDILYFLYVNFFIVKRHNIFKIIIKIQSKDHNLTEFFIDTKDVIFYITNFYYFQHIIFFIENQYKTSEVLMVCVVLQRF